MAEYIEREALMERLKFKRYTDRLTNKRYAGLESAIAQVNKMPTADVVEVRHGYWDDCMCSVCGAVNPTLYLDEWTMKYRSKEMPYCPNCGAKMDEKDGADE